MKRSWFVAGACLCGLAFAGAALLEATRHENRYIYRVLGALYPDNLPNSTKNPKLKLWPLDGLDIATFLIFAVCLSLAGGAGIGGGAVLVPCFILVRGWPTSIAVAMSNVTVLGGSLANFICNVNRHRSNGARTIDWELILMMEPTTIAGALFGAILNKLLPNYLTTYLLTAFIIFMGIRLYQKGRQAYAKETALIKSAKQAARAAAKAAAAAGSADSDQLQLGPTAWQQQQQQQSRLADAPVRTSLTIRTVDSKKNSRTNSRSLNRSLSRSFTNSFSRSFSRLSAPLLADFPRTPTPTAAAAVAAAAAAAAAAVAQAHASFQQQQQQHEASAFAAADGNDDAGDDVGNAVPLTPHALRENSQGQFLDLITCAILCQGDVIGNVVEPIIAAPLISELSSSSSSSQSETDDPPPPAAAAAGLVDLEAGFDDQDDLQQPLLRSEFNSPAAAAAAAIYINPSSGSNEKGLVSNQGLVDQSVERVYSPDGVMVVDQWGNSSSSDVEHGRKDSNALLPAAAAAAKGVLYPHGSDLSLTRAQAPHTPKAETPAAAGAAAGKEPNIPLPHFITLLFLSAWVVAADIVQSSTVCGSLQYWGVTLSVLVPVAIILLVFRQKLMKKYRHDELAPGTELPEGQLHWNRKTTLLYPALCSSAGLIAGLFGIGGGVVKGPLMLELGVAPDVAAATSATMIMFTAASACVVYSRFGQLLVDYGAVMFIMGFIVTLGSQLLTFILIKLLGRRSVIIFMMVVLMSMACSIMLLESVQQTLNLIAHPEELSHFGKLCPEAKGGVGCVLTQLVARLGF